MKISVSAHLNQVQVQRLRDVAGEDALPFHGHLGAGASIEPSFMDCEIVFENVAANWLARNPALEWVQLESVGFGEYAGLDLGRIEQAGDADQSRRLLCQTRRR